MEILSCIILSSREMVRNDGSLDSHLFCKVSLKHRQGLESGHWVQPQELVAEVGSRVSMKYFQAAEWTHTTEGLPEGTAPPEAACALGSARG